MIKRIKSEIEILKKRYVDYSLRIKLLVAATLIVLIPMMLLGLVSNIVILNIVSDQSQRAYLQNVRQMILNINDQVENVEASVTMARSNARLGFIFRHLIYDNVTLGQEYDYYKEIDAIKHIMLAQTGAVRVRMALDAKATYIKPHFDMFPEEILMEETACQDNLDQLSGHWFPPDSFSEAISRESGTLVYCAEMVDIYARNNHQGYLLVEVKADEVFSALREAQMGPGCCVLVHRGDEIFYFAGDESAMEDLRRILWEENAPAPAVTYQMVSSKVENTGWEVVLLVSQDAVVEQSNNVRNSIFMMALVISGIAIGLALWITGNINRRLNAILFVVHRMDAGEFGTSVPVEGNDEYATLMASVNMASVRTAELMERLELLQKQTKRAEMRALYEQISPHFIYNTLDVIRWLALTDQPKLTAELTASLIHYLRLNLNHGKELTLVENEVNEIEQYINIMNYRYRDSIEFTTEVEDAVRNQPVLKLILQPLVENAVLHGVMCRADRHGSIHVSAKKEGESLIFTVEDNGVGMSQDKADRLVREELTDHYGIYSVNKRLKTFYGEDSGITIRSAINEGCTVRVEIFLGSGVMVWLGDREAEERLAELKREFREEAERMGINRERRW